ncbi:hypothetical protein [Massilia sp. TN1-12]|uniref:hypothetical protein n=1 Tax=Massilia paldalensis TaxID=3377675 RepID=UPI00384FBE59
MEQTRAAYHALDTTLAKFMPVAQRMVLTSQLAGEEAEGIAQSVNAIAKVIAEMPETYQTEGQCGSALVHLHYFIGSVEAWIVEKDRGDPDNGDTSQTQAYGLVTLTGNVEDGEIGYVNIEELVAAGAELDLYWTPKTLDQVQEQK